MRFLFAVIALSTVISCNMIPINYPVYGNIPGSSPAPVSANEAREFSQLMEADKVNKKKVTAEVLTYLLNDTDPKDTRTAAVITNDSNCDIIVRLVGVKNDKVYNLPVLRKDKNQFVIDKGGYTLKSNICGASYYSQKIIVEPLILKLNSN